MTEREIITFLKKVTAYKELDCVNPKLPAGGLEEQEGYILESTRRYKLTLDWCEEFIRKNHSGEKNLKILEIGIEPYHLSSLLIHSFGCQVTGISVPQGVWLGRDDPIIEEEAFLCCNDSISPVNIKLYRLNVEKDKFPFDDETFDLILCTEVIEHLLFNPTHLLAETHRVCKKGSGVLITTPNSLRAIKMIKLILNKNIERAYGGWGVYARHNREYSMGELVGLLKGCNYSIYKKKLAVDFSKYSRRLPRYSKLFKVVESVLSMMVFVIPLSFFRNKVEHVFILATPFGEEPKWYYPDFLYISWYRDYLEKYGVRFD